MNSGFVTLLTKPELITGDTLTRCPSCAGVDLTLIGPLPEAFHFLIQRFTHPINRGNLVECQSCGLLFRNPCLPLAIMNDLYSSNPETTAWNGSEDTRDDFLQVIKFVSSLGMSKLKIMDIGCYNGALLHSIRNACADGDRFSFFGIEPSLKAAYIAETNGIKIVGRSIYDLKKNSSEKYDVIVLTDVFEHLQGSDLMMQYLSESLMPNGYILITTGAYDSKPYRKAKNLYYYGAMPEHISFFSERHGKWLARKHHLDVVYKAINLERKTFNTSKLILISLAFLALRLLPLGIFCRNSLFVNKLADLRGRGIQNTWYQPDHALWIFHKKTR